MSNNDLPCSKCGGQHHPVEDCSGKENVYPLFWFIMIISILAIIIIKVYCNYKDKPKGVVMTNEEKDLSMNNYYNNVLLKGGV